MNDLDILEEEAKEILALKSDLATKARKLLLSKQDVREWPGVQFLKSGEVLQATVQKLHTLIENQPLDLDYGFTIDGLPLRLALEQFERLDPSEQHAVDFSFYCGLREAADWIGLTHTKWSTQPSEVCALEVIAAVEGIPTSRQRNHQSPDKLIGCACKKTGQWSWEFLEGTTNSIHRVVTDWDAPATDYKDKAREKFSSSQVIDNAQLEQAYQKGAEVAFIQYLYQGKEWVSIHPIEELR